MRWLICLVLLFPVWAVAAPLTATAVTDGADLTLSDGTTLHLAGLHAPYPGTDLARAATAQLAALTRNADLTLADPVTDRYGRTAADATATVPGAAPVWLPGALLQAGLAFVYPTGDEPRLADLRAAEQAARAANNGQGRGIWADPAYADLTPAQAKAHQGGFAFVAGPVVAVVKLKDRTYLNFSTDWHRDFSAVIAAHDNRAFAKAGLDLPGLRGKTVRLRGWIGRDFRPLMTVSQPAQIEIIAPVYQPCRRALIPCPSSPAALPSRSPAAIS